MGNTNLPQFGAAETKNSKDTLSGENQLTEEQQRRRKKASNDVGPSPGRPKNSPRPLPGQNVDREGAGNSAAELDADDLEALAGHANTGHSSSDAT
ncbi:MAG: hypothetical protein EPN74_11275 [Rhodanobacter sp.]|nr:MAG: hypothetical protein EPN74_11275 [Rhodanobacter sp.]